MGEDKKTLTVFSTLAKNSVKFFSQNRFTSAFLLLEGYPRLYDRLMFPAKLADGTDTTGWVYVMHNLPEMAQVIESGCWKEYRHG